MRQSVVVDGGSGPRIGGDGVNDANNDGSLAQDLEVEEVPMQKVFNPGGGNGSGGIVLIAYPS